LLAAAAAVSVAIVALVPKDALPGPVRRVVCAVWDPHCQNAELLQAVRNDNVTAVKQLLTSGAVNLKSRSEVRVGGGWRPLAAVGQAAKPLPPCAGVSSVVVA
jgi:hypothetical protein